MRKRAAFGALALTILLSAVALASTHKLERPWPFKTLQLGLIDPLGDAATLHAQVPLGLRYHYLSGGTNTGHGWISWDDGSYVQNYIQESEAVGMVPVFTYYQLRQSLPGASQSDERLGDLKNLQNTQTMKSYFEDFRNLMKDISNSKGPVIVQIEPDLWGYVEQTSPDAQAVPASVSSSGLLELKGLPNNVAGFAQALVRLRDIYAPHVILGYHLSIWGTGKDIQLSDPSFSEVSLMSLESARFYHSLGVSFDVIFTEYVNRDAGYAQNVEGKGTKVWWNSVDYAHMQAFLHDLYSRLHMPIVLWQIPLGNTVMDILNNTPYHYQDNHVQWLLGSGSRKHLIQYVHDGVVALLFGSGVSQGTCACDADHDGVVNNPPIDGNTRRSFTSEDDGGYFKAVARRYYHLGALYLH